MQSCSSAAREPHTASPGVQPAGRQDTAAGGEGAAAGGPQAHCCVHEGLHSLLCKCMLLAVTDSRQLFFLIGHPNDTSRT